jgi:hypothetical protein
MGDYTIYIGECGFNPFEDRDYYRYRTLVLLHNEAPELSTIERYVVKYHRGCYVSFVSIEDIINDKIPELFTDIENNKYSNFYITTDNKKLRKQIRHIIKERCGVDIHVQLYSKIVKSVNRRGMLK